MVLSKETQAKIKKQIDLAVAEGPAKYMPLKRGNKKLGMDTIIFNMSTALECAAAAAGECSLRDICYALRDEGRFHHVVPKARKRQQLTFDALTAEQIALDITLMADGDYKTAIEYVRFNEAGDFKSQLDVDKLFKIAELVPNLTFYGYTHRKNLDYSKKPLNVVLNGSGFMLDNCFKTVKQFSEAPEALKCDGNCPECDYCKKAEGALIEILEH